MYTQFWSLTAINNQKGQIMAHWNKKIFLFPDNKKPYLDVRTVEKCRLTPFHEFHSMTLEMASILDKYL